MMPRGRGVYVLWLYLAGERELQVGALGRHRLPSGYYAYVGSAQGGVVRRLRRHARKVKPLHWHIDYLRVYAALVRAAAAEVGREYECALAEALRRAPGATVVVPGFGSSDCRCAAHLFYFASSPEVMLDPAALLPGLAEVPLPRQ